MEGENRSEDTGRENGLAVFGGERVTLMKSATGRGAPEQKARPGVLGVENSRMANLPSRARVYFRRKRIGTADPGAETLPAQNQARRSLLRGIETLTFSI